eukprot:tig00020904_g15190.t1
MEERKKPLGTSLVKARKLANLSNLSKNRPPSGEAANASARGPGARPKRPAERPEAAASASPRNKENCNRIENTASASGGDTAPVCRDPKASPRAPLRTLEELSTAAANKSETMSAGARRDSAGDSTPPQGSASSPVLLRTGQRSRINTPTRSSAAPVQQHSSPGTGEPPAQRRKLGDQILRDVEKYELWNAFHNSNILPLVQECNRLRQECQEKDRAIAEQELELESVRGRAFQYKHLYEREKDKRTEELPSSDQQQLQQLQAEDARAVRFWQSLPEDVRGLHVPRKELLEAAASTIRHRVGALYSLILYLSGEQGTDEGGRWGENAYQLVGRLLECLAREHRVTGAALYPAGGAPNPVLAGGGGEQNHAAAAAAGAPAAAPAGLAAELAAAKERHAAELAAAEERHAAGLAAAQERIAALDEELAKTRRHLDIVHKNRFSLIEELAELRGEDWGLDRTDEED